MPNSIAFFIGETPMIKWYQHTQTGAPGLNGQAGSLAAVLNACLINGFNLKTLTTLTRLNNIATATVDAGHGFRAGDIVQIAGADEAAWNGDKRIRNVTTNQFEFEVTGSPLSPASGTITAKIAPLGWSSPFTAANKTVYRSNDITSTRLFLQVEESPIAGDANYGAGTRTAAISLFETMTDASTGTVGGSSPAKVWWRKAQDENNSERAWVLIGDSKRFWLCVAWNASYAGRYVPYFFGDFPSFKAGDAYGAVLAGYMGLVYNWSDPSGYEACDYVYAVGQGVGDSGIWLARGYSQLGGRINANWVCGVAGSGIGIGATGLQYPNPSDNGIYVMPLLIQEQTGPSLRGRVPGLLAPLHRLPADEPTKYEGFALDGVARTLLVMRGSYADGSARLAFDITGPWE
jgi:hypothetical protein